MASHQPAPRPDAVGDRRGARARCSTRSRGPGSASARRSMQCRGRASRRATCCSRTGLGTFWPPGPSRRTGIESTRAPVHPDLLPADLTGSCRLRPAAGCVRVPPRSALHRPAARRRDQPHPAQDPVRTARGHAEHQVTVEGETTFSVRAPFHVLATANPIEYEGTFPKAPGGPKFTGSSWCHFRLPAPLGGVRRARPSSAAAPRGGRPRAGHRRRRAAGMQEAAETDGRRASAATAWTWANSRPATTPDVLTGARPRVASAGAHGAGVQHYAARPRPRRARGRQGVRPVLAWRTGSRSSRTSG